MEGFEFFYEPRVRFYDTDLQGVMHHTHYFRYFETARVEYMRNLNLIKNGDFVGSSTVAVVHAEADYKRPLKFDEKFKIYTRVSELKNASMTFEYRMIKSSDSSLIATALTRIAAIDRKSHGPVKLPEEMTSRIKEFEGL